MATSVFAQILNPQVDSIPMRDGKKLAADVYIPTGSGSGPFPVILIQTPYNRLFQRLNLPLGVGTQLNGFPYAFVVVDWRGFWGSASAFSLTADRGNDGYDVVEWIASQSWSDGKVGTFGPSALGRIQYLTAKKNPPHLTCICPSVAASQYDYLEYYPGGCLRTEYVEQLDALGFGTSTVVLAHPTYDIVWQYTEPLNLYPDSIQVPAFMIGGWYDHNVEVMFTLFDLLQTQGAPAVAAKHKMLFGPWAHGGHGTSTVGGPSQGQMSHPNAVGWNDSLALRFFDFYLRNIANGWENDPALRYYVPGEEAWVNAPSWPPSNTTPTPFYLHPGGKLSSQSHPSSTDTLGTIVYDPRDPSPTVGGPTLRADLDQGPYDQAPVVESRSDILIFSTDTLTQPLVIRGEPSVILHVRSDRPDTDFAVRLTDVFPDGRSMLIRDGIRRMRFRSSYSSPDTIIPGNHYEIEVELAQLAYTWLPGHRLRLDISSSNYPRFDCNLNNGDAMYTAGDTLIANNTLHYSAIKPSRIILPIVNGTTEITPSNASNFRVMAYPNPTAGNLSLEWGDVLMKEVRLMDLSGRLLEKWQVGNAANGINVSVAGRPSGTYLIQFMAQDGKQAIKKVILE